MDQKAIRNILSIQQRAAVLTGHEMINRLVVDQRMPFDTGHAQNESTFVDDTDIGMGHVYIITDTPYAAKIYFNPQFNFQKGKNANAGGEWWEDFIRGSRSKEPSQIYGEFIKRMMRGGI